MSNFKTKKQFLNDVDYEIRNYIEQKDKATVKRRKIVKQMRNKKQRSKYKGLL